MTGIVRKGRESHGVGKAALPGFPPGNDSKGGNCGGSRSKGKERKRKEGARKARARDVLGISTTRWTCVSAPRQKGRRKKGRVKGIDKEARGISPSLTDS